jgi:glutamine synthetase
MLMAGLTASRTASIRATRWTRTSTTCPRRAEEIPTVCGSLREALGSLNADRDFLKAGGVSTTTRSTRISS